MSILKVDVGRKVGAQWLMSKALGVDQEWSRSYLVVEEDGTLKLFEDETTMKMKASFDLTLWTQDDIVESTVSTEIGVWRITMESDGGSIQFAFESEGDSHEVMGWMKRFILSPDPEDGDQEEEDGASSPFKIKWIFECLRCGLLIEYGQNTDTLRPHLLSFAMSGL